MKIFKYTFVFFLLTLNLRLYSHNNITNVTNVYYNITNNNYPGPQNENLFDEDNYNKPNDQDFWKNEASKTDDTYSFWFWLSNVSVLSTGLCCILSYFLFPEWFLLLATILGLLYIIHFFVQIISPTVQCLFNLKSREDFRESVRDCKLVVRSSITIEHEKRVKKEESGDVEQFEVKNEVIKRLDNKCEISLTANIGEYQLGKSLNKCWIDLNIELGATSKNEVDSMLDGQLNNVVTNLLKGGYLGERKIKRNVSWSVSGIENYMLIADNPSAKPWHVSSWWFFLFTILPFSQFYKLWVKRYCDERKMTITCTGRQYNI